MRLLFLLLLLPVVFGYADPPISDVMGDNADAAQGLEGYYNASTASDSTVIIHLGNYTTGLDVSASLDIVGPSLMVDNMTYPVDGLLLVVARGTEQEHLPAFPADGLDDFICDYDWFYGGGQYPWRCDFDGDTCAEFENHTIVEYDVDATFTFRDVSESVPVTSTLVPFPPVVLEEMEDSSGTEMLNVSLDGDVTFIYVVNDRVSPDCSSSYVNFSRSVPFSANRSFMVAGVHKLFFLRTPVLREQWFRNNRFDAVVLSQSPLYKASVSLNGNQSRNFTLKNFTVVYDQYDMQQILSNKTNETGCSESETNGTTPVQLEHENHSFSYVYEFNYTYAGLGVNNLSLSVDDSFLGFAQYNESILSRMLSYNGSATETGAPFDEDISRKSSGFRKEEMASLTVGLGLAAFIVLLAFLNYWLVR